MDAHEIEEAVSQARRIAEDAATVTLEGCRAGGAVHKKGAIDLVTEWDLRSEELIRERLAAAYPDHAIVGEEKDDVEGEGDRVWYVDPLDGTTNFAHGHPFFCVSMALHEGAEGLVGVVVAPALKVSWQAGRGLGAFRNGEPCRVTATSTLDDALGATGFPYDRRVADDDNLAEYRAFMKVSQGLRRCGSAAIDLALVADGTYDFYWEQRLQPWDMCAGAVLVTEAGGRLSDYDGSPADPRSGRLVATNGGVHDGVVHVLRRTRG